MIMSQVYIISVIISAGQTSIHSTELILLYGIHGACMRLMHQVLEHVGC